MIMKRTRQNRYFDTESSRRAGILSILLLLVAQPIQSEYFYFDPKCRINDNDISLAQTCHISAAGTGQLLSVWGEDDELTFETYMISYRSIDGGITWDHPVRIDDGNSPVKWDGHDMSMNESGLAAVVWRSKDATKIYCSVSTDGGYTWLNPNVYVNDSMENTRGEACVAVGSERILVIWADNREAPPGDTAVYCTYSTDEGETWRMPNIRVNDNTDAPEGWHMSCTALPDGGFAAAWTSGRGGDNDYDVWAAVSHDGGETWEPNVQVNSDYSGYQIVPTIMACLNGYIYIAYHTNQGLSDEDLHVAYSTDGGMTWEDNPDPITPPGAYSISYKACSCLDDDIPVIGWIDDRGAGLDPWDMYLAVSTDEGITWSDPNILVGASPTLYWDPGTLDMTPYLGNELMLAFHAYFDNEVDFQYVIRARRTPTTPGPTNTPRPTTTPRPTYTGTRTPTRTPTFTMTPTPAHTGTPSPAPTHTPPPSPRTPTPPPSPTTGVSITMPSVQYHPGETCWCRATVRNASAHALSGYPLFVVLDVIGVYYFAPSFSDFDHYLDGYPTFAPGNTDVTVIPEFVWPEGAGSAEGIEWCAALTDPEITTVIGGLGRFTFGWE